MNPEIWLKKIRIYDKMKGSLMESTHISIYSLQSGKHCHAIFSKSTVKSKSSEVGRWVGTEFVFYTVWNGA